MKTVNLFFSVLVCLLVLYAPDFKFFGVGPYLISMFLIFIYMVCFGWLESRYISLYRQDFKAYASLLIFLAGLVLVAFINDGDVVTSVNWLLYLGIVLPSFSVIYWFVFVGGRPDVFLMSISLAALVQSLFIFGEYFSLLFTEVIDSLLERPSLAINSYRASGIASMTGDGLSFVQFMGFFSSVTLTILSDKFSSKFFWCVLSIVIFISMFFVGRTGVFLCVLLLFLLLFYKWFLFSLVASSLFIFFSLLAVNLSDVTFLSGNVSPLQHSLQPFVAIFKGDISLSPSLNDLITNHVVFPDSIEPWVIGVGQWVTPNGGNFKGTDIGYIRIIWYSGLLGFFLAVFYFIVISRLIVKATTFYRACFIAFFLAFIVANLKFPFLFWSQVAFFFIVLYLSSTRYNFMLLRTEEKLRSRYAS